MDLVSEALGKLAKARERPYLDENADREAAERYYADVDPEEEGALTRLLIQTHLEQPSYSPARELYPWIDLQPNRMLRSVYTLDEYEPEELIREAAAIEAQRASLRARATAESTVEELEPYNCEHVVPQSWFDHDEPMRGDLHHLFTSERKCNSFRGNSPFTDYPDYQKVVRERCGKSDPAGFEPNAGKGMVARATLYYLLRYPAPSVAPNIELLLEWHDAEPPTEYERHRNAAIHERQGNRNPLIDHPDWASRIAFSPRDSL